MRVGQANPERRPVLDVAVRAADAVVPGCLRRARCGLHRRGGVPVTVLEAHPGEVTMAILALVTVAAAALLVLFPEDR